MARLKTKIGLRTKVVLAMLIVGSIPVILGLILTSFQGTTQLRGAIGSNFEGLAKEAAHKTDLAVTREVTELDHLATVSTEIREAVQQANQVYGGLSGAALAKQLDEASQNWRQEQEGLARGSLIANRASKYLRDSLKISKREGVYIAIFVVDQKGALVASVNRYPDYLHSQSDWWKKTYHQGRGKIYLGDLYYDDKAMTHVFDIAVPIMDEERIEVLGVVKQVIDLKAFLKPSIHEIQFGKTGHAMLVDSDGKVIICPVLPTGLILPDKELVRTITAPEPGWFTARDDGHGGKNSIVGFDPVEQVNLLIAGAGGKKWHSFIRQDPKELYGPINSLLFSVSMAAMFSVGLLVLMGFYISKKMVQPIHVLHEGAELIGKGNLNHRLKVETKDELEQLASEFNTMAEKLQQSYTTLEQKVADRTKELSALNMIATTLNQSLNLQEILEETLNKVLEAMKQEAGMIRLWENDIGRGILKAHKGLSEELRRAEVDAGMGDSISGKVAQTRGPIFLENAKDAVDINSPLINFGFQSVACVPIQSKTKLIGTLSIASRTPRLFSPSDRQLLTSIGNQVGTAVENATLYIRERQMVEGLKEMDRLKAEFLSNLSHELRTPLTSIIGFSELLLDKIPGPLNKDQEEYVKNMQGSGQHLLELINNLLDLSKIKAGKMEMHTKEFYIRNLVQVVTNTVSPLVNKKGLYLNTYIEEGISHIYADEGKLKQCLLNLLSNAIKFTPAGGEIRIDARSSSLEDQPALRLSVEDTGIGIKKEDVGKIFEEFRQAEGSYTREYQGTGLGLPITKRFVEMHGGKIWVESEAGKGSKFVMLIPTRITYVPTRKGYEEEAKETADAVEETPLGGAEVEQGPAPIVSEIASVSETMEREKLCILVVEDDPKTNQLLTLYFTEAGYQVEQAYDGETALEKAKAVKPFAITLDIMLPKMDGWEVLQRLKSMPETRDIPVIIVSIIENQELGLGLGAADYFTKPIERHALLESLRKHENALKIKIKPISVLIIDDDPEIIRLIEAFLEAEGIGLIKARSGEEGVSLAIETHPDLIILDLLMPEVNGFEVIDRLKQHPTARNIPVIICTGKDLTQEEKAILSGRIREIIHKGKSLREDLINEVRKFEKLYPDKAKMVDGLTGLYNERYFQNRLSDEVNRLRRFKRPFSLLMANIDHFKHYNQMNGTHRGDKVLIELGDLCRKGVRAADPICRHGGSTFSVILPETLRDHAQMIGDRLRYNVVKTHFPHEEAQPGGSLTLSVGVATFVEGTKSSEEVIAKVSRALQAAKSDGGNRVAVATGEGS